MKLKNILLNVFLISLFVFATPVIALAAPHFTLSPTSGNYSVNDTFSVILGVDSETQKVAGIDIKANFDSAKIELVTVEKASITNVTSVYKFTYANQAIYNNDTGNFEVTLTPDSFSMVDAPAVKHDLLKLTFKAKANGVATFSYVCQANLVTETNIINDASTDVVDCTANQSGSYTITGTSNNTTPNPTSAVTTPTTRPSNNTLPNTGGVSNTIALILIGISGVMAAVYFKFL